MRGLIAVCVGLVVVLGAVVAAVAADSFPLLPTHASSTSAQDENMCKV